MNLALIDPFILAQDFPDALIGKIRSGHSTGLRFNRKGDLLASGRADGTVVIFDVETNGVARKLRGHTRQIQSLSWSYDGRYLLSSAQDCKSILWDLEDGSRLRTVRFEAPVYTAELHPFNHLLFVAALLDDHPVLVNISTSTPGRHQIPTTPRRSATEGEELNEKQAALDLKQLTLVTIFNATGSHIITGTNRGWINIIEVRTRTVIHSTRLCASLILLLRLSASGRHVLCNASDKIVRTIILPQFGYGNPANDDFVLEIEHRFQDVVQKLSWNHAVFSSSGDYVAATTYMNHDVYLWERGHGSLVKILECPDEELGNIEWHPHRPFVAACGLETGFIYIWSIIAPQRWSALAPDFAEVEENVDYVEREDEFDIHPIEEIHKRRLDLEDETVDVLTFEPAKYDNEETSFSMPVLLEIGDNESEDEMIEAGRSVVRRKSPGEGRERKSGNADNGRSDSKIRIGMTNAASRGKARVR